MYLVPQRLRCLSSTQMQQSAMVLSQLTANITAQMQMRPRHTWQPFHMKTPGRQRGKVNMP